MVKVSLKWFCLLLCAVAMITSSAVQAQRRTKKNAQKSSVSAKDALEKENAKKEADKEDEIVVEEITDEQFDTDEESVSADESEDASGEALAKTEAPSGEPAEGTEEAIEGSKDEEKKADDKKASVEEEKKETKEEAVSEEKVEEEVVTEEPVSADASEEALAKTEAPSEEPTPEEEQPELGPDEIMGIDTVDLEDPQGNWLYKRVWWERAEAKYEKIRMAVTSVLETRTVFFAKRADLNKNTLDPFYIKIGFSQGELKERLAERISQLEKDIIDKSDVERLEKLEADKQTLEDFQKEVAMVVKQDEEVENAIMMLVEQANKMRNYEQQAWQDFKNIARVLDDKKARELFYKVDGAWRNIQELKQYVESNFSTGFDQLVQRLTQQVQKVDAVMQQLKEKGISLIQAAQDADADEDEEEEPPQGIISRFIITPIKTVFRAIWDVIMWPIRKIMGTTKPDAEEVDEAESADVVSEPTDKKEPEAEQVAVEKEAAPSTTTPPSMSEEAAVETPEVAEPEIQVDESAEVSEESSSADESEEALAKTEATQASIKAMPGTAADRAPADEEEEQAEEVVEVDESEPMTEELDTSLEIEEE